MTGVTVRLYDGSGNLIATALTDQDGEYYFSSDAGTIRKHDLQFGASCRITAYQVRFDNPLDHRIGRAAIRVES